MRIAPAHVGDKLELLWRMLSGVMERPSGTITQGLNRAIKTAFPAVDVLSIGFVLNGSVSNPKFVSVSNKR